MVLKRGVHITVDAANWPSYITCAPLSLQKIQTWIAFLPYVLVRTAKPESKMVENRNKEWLHPRLKKSLSEKV